VVLGVNTPWGVYDIRVTPLAGALSVPAAMNVADT
jgi:hypothetical protein